MICSSVILSAGYGTRFKTKISKMTATLAEIPFYMHVIHTVSKMSIENVVLVTDEAFGTKKFTEKMPNVKEVYQHEKLGSGHAVQVAFKEIDVNSDAVFILYGDSPLITENTLFSAKKILESDENIGIVIISMERDDGAEYGRLMFENFDHNCDLKKINSYVKEKKISDYNVVSIVEKGCDIKSDDVIKSNFYNAGFLIKKEILDKFLFTLSPCAEKNNEILITDLVNLSYENGYKNSVQLADKNELIGINTREDLANCELIFQARMREKFLKNGVTLKDQNSVYFAYDTEIDEDVTIYPNVFFGKNVKIHSNVEIFPFSVLEDVEVFSNVKIGPFARIRGGVELLESSEIGNFVEIKKSKIGPKTKIKHLSYIGDTEIGEKTNVGAGTVTCNYDGVSKFKSKIGDNVFVGSKACIISPVNIESNSLIAAGTVVTDDVKENELIISRTKQENIQDGAKRYFQKRIKEKK